MILVADTSVMVFPGEKTANGGSEEYHAGNRLIFSQQLTEKLQHCTINSIYFKPVSLVSVDAC